MKSVKTGPGFTLIELLVVIAIIALLMSILMPALKKIKDVAAMKICGNNTRQIMMACLAYAPDNNEEVPRSVTRYKSENTALVGQEVLNSSWVCLPVRDPSRTPANVSDFISPNTATQDQRLAGIRHGTLYPYLENTEVYHCPRDDRMHKYGLGYRTYSLNHSIFNGIQDPGSINAWGRVAKRVSDIKAPGSRMAVVEQADPRGFNWDGLVFSSGGVNGWEEPLANWHQGGFMYSCFDGHVETYQILEEATQVYIAECREKPDVWLHYENSKAVVIKAGSANQDLFNLTRLLDVYGFTSKWSWTLSK
ncbi:MAG: type II secretion system protein [Anaerohalosphaeraceae bacterium]